jgi:hypothetical protein
MVEISESAHSQLVADRSNALHLYPRVSVFPQAVHPLGTPIAANN